MSGQRSIEPKPAATGEEKILQIPEKEFIQTRDKVSLVDLFSHISRRASVQHDSKFPN